MAHGLLLSNAQVTAEATAIGQDTTGFGGAHLRLYSGTKPATADTAITDQVLLVTFTIPVSSGNSITNGVITFGAISDATAVADGTAAFFRVVASNGTTVVCDGTIGTADADLVLNSVVITNGANVSITAFTYTVTK
jgi:hypothetical protein